MAENEPEQKQGKTYEAFALYDIVRGEIFNELVKCLNLLRVVGKYESESESDAVNTEEFMDLRTELVNVLYLHLRPKIPYIGKNNPYEKLRELDKYASGRVSIKELGLSETKQYLMICRDLIEALGVTRFEREKFNPTDWPAQKVGL